jgi:hypothetical protein
MERDTQKNDGKEDLKDLKKELPYVFKFSKPVKYGDKTIDQLTVRREPTVGETKDLPVSVDSEKMSRADLLPIVSAMTGETETFLETIPTGEYYQLCNVVFPFLLV